MHPYNPSSDLRSSVLGATMHCRGRKTRADPLALVCLGTMHTLAPPNVQSVTASQPDLLQGDRIQNAVDLIRNEANIGVDAGFLSPLRSTDQVI